MTLDKIAAPDGREIISPEGVEELALSHVEIRLTLTGGGKFRLYGRARRWENGASALGDAWETIGIYDDRQAADKQSAQELLTVAALAMIATGQTSNIKRGGA